MSEEHTDTRPVITHREASWHATVAALRARRKAALQSTAPEAREAIAIAAAMDATPIPLTDSFAPVTIGTLWAIEISGEHDAELVGGVNGADQALWCLTLTQPERVLLSLLTGDTDDIREGMLAEAARPAADYYALDRHYGEQMRKLQSLAGGGPQPGDKPGKPPETPSPSSATEPTPQAGP